MGTIEKMWYSDKVNKWMLDNHGISLLEFCSLMKYPERELEILSVKRDKESMMALYRKYQPLFDESQKNELCKKRKGKNRTWTEYFHAVIAGWAMEDILSLWLAKNGFEVDKSGVDRCRKLLVTSITNAPDIVLSKNGHPKRKVELVFESEDYISKYGYIEKRLRALWDAHEAGSVFLFVDISCNKYVVIDFALEDIKLHLRHHKRWDKDVHRYVLEENGKIPRPVSMLIEELEAVCLSETDGTTPHFEEVEDEDCPPVEFATGGRLRTDTESVEQVAAVESEKPIQKAVKKGFEQETETKKPIVVDVPKPKQQESPRAVQDDENTFDCEFV